jgi:hypothetical protein
MPLRDFTCKQCNARQERFYWASAGIPACTCGGELDMLPLDQLGTYRKTSIFPYDCPHVDGTGKPITIESLSHLRQVEKQYGVVFSAFSQNPSNPDHIKDLPQHRVAGRERSR